LVLDTAADAVDGKATATVTSGQWKCSYELVTVISPLLLPCSGVSSFFQTYTWESSLADITYLPLAVKQAEIWLLVFRKPETEQSEDSEYIVLETRNRNIIAEGIKVYNRPINMRR
jgi:hypothetical protein